VDQTAASISERRDARHDLPHSLRHVAVNRQHLGVAGGRLVDQQLAQLLVDGASLAPVFVRREGDAVVGFDGTKTIRSRLFMASRARSVALAASTRAASS